MPTKAELAAELAELKERQKGWGDAALAFADEHGLCSDVQDFLDEHEIPYTSREIEVRFTVEVLAKVKKNRQVPIDRSFLERSIDQSIIDTAISDYQDELFDEDFKMIDVSTTLLTGQTLWKEGAR